MTLHSEDFILVPLPAANTIADFIKKLPPFLFYQKSQVKKRYIAYFLPNFRCFPYVYECVLHHED